MYPDMFSAAVLKRALLSSDAFNDSRVGIWVAEVRDSTCTKCSSASILKIEMTGGHFDEGVRYEQCRNLSYDYVFLMKVMGYFPRFCFIFILVLSLGLGLYIKKL
ncbi:hypothetical protein Droror1_Dr00025504 [Drosera rotundifolia]